MKQSSPCAAFRCENLLDPDFFLQEQDLIPLSFSLSRKEAIDPVHLNVDHKDHFYRSGFVHLIICALQWYIALNFI